MSEVSDKVSEEASATNSGANEAKEPETHSEVTKELASDQIIPEESNQCNKTAEARAVNSSKNVDLVLISDDEGEEQVDNEATPQRLNGQSTPNVVESVESDDLDEVGLIEEYSDDSSSDNQDDEVEITGVSMANSELGTVGGMDQLLRTLIEQGWTENEIMQQLRGMIAPYQRRQRLNVFNTLDDVVERIRRVNKIIVVSGAGISVSCGIPDFRSETGLYARLSKDYPTLPNPTAMFDLHYFLNDPKPFYTFAKELWPGQFKPSPCHRFIKLLESHGKLLRNYTQNIDTLEQVAGIQNVIQCHGSFATASCIYCRFQVPGDDIKNDIMQSRAPLCPKCEEKRLLDGQEVFEEFARTNYRNIKRKLRRREKAHCASSDSESSDSSASNSPEMNKMRKDLKKSLTRPATRSDAKIDYGSSEDNSQNAWDEADQEAPSCSSPCPKAEPAASADNKNEEQKEGDETVLSEENKKDELSMDVAKEIPLREEDAKSENRNTPPSTSNDKEKSSGTGEVKPPKDAGNSSDPAQDSLKVSSTTNAEAKSSKEEAGSSKTKSIIEGLLTEPQPSSSKKRELRASNAQSAKPPKVRRPPLDPLLKPDIVFFGEDLPRTFFDHAEEDLEQAELIIVIGSSMKVKPVASIPDFVRESTPRVLINREPVRHISFDAELLGDADEIVQQLCHRLEWDSPVDEARPELKRTLRTRVLPLDELNPLPKRSDVERSKAAAKNEESEKTKKEEKKAAEGEAGTSGNGMETSQPKDEADDSQGRSNSADDRREYEEPCPLFGSRCQCPLSWNIAHYLPEDAVVKMQPSTYIFPGATINHPKHVYTALPVNDSFNVDSDSDLGGMENPIEVSSSDGAASDSNESEVQELYDLDSGNNSVSVCNDDVNKTDDSRKVAPVSEKGTASDEVCPEEKEAADMNDIASVSCENIDAIPSDNVCDTEPEKSSPEKTGVKSPRPLKRLLSNEPSNDDTEGPNGKIQRVSESETQEPTISDSNCEQMVTDHGDNNAT